MNRTRAERNIAWAEKYIRIPEGKFVGQPLKMAEFMKDDFRAIYDNPAVGGTRTAIISRGRKNAKTVESAIITLLHLCGPEATPNSQLFSAAQSRDQAAILFALAAKMVRLNPELDNAVTIRDTAKQLACMKLGTLYRALSADASTAYGLSPKLIIHDELGQVRGPKSELYDALETATAAQENPLSIIISTQAPNEIDLLSQLINQAQTGENPRLVLRFNTAPEEMDPFSIEAIRAANPAFDVFMNQQEVLDMQGNAKALPVRQAEFENLVLNRRVEIKAPLISKPIWNKCGFPVVEEFKGPVFGGLDLSAVSDLTAKVYVSQVFNEDKTDYKWHVKPEFWLPEEGIAEKARQDKVSYVEWHNLNLLNLAPGRTIEYEYVAEQIFNDFKSGMDIRKIAFDKWNWKHFKPWLLKVGFKDADLDEKNPSAIFTDFGQGYYSMSPAIRQFESLVLNEKIAHGNNPVLTWNVGNAKVTPDPAGNRKLDKMKATGRIDGLIALIMALAIAETTEAVKKQNPTLLFI